MSKSSFGGSLSLPSGSTAERGLPEDGLIRYNTTNSAMEIYADGTWRNVGVLPEGTDKEAAPASWPFLFAGSGGGGGGSTLSGTANQINLTGGVLSLADPLIIPGIDSVTVPSGATGDRSLTPVNGMIRYNTTTNQLEGYINTAWIDLGAAGGSGAPITSQYLTLAVDATLTNERVLTPGLGLLGTDGGAGTTYTVAIDLNTGAWTTTTTIVGNDYAIFQDVTDNSTQKRTWANILNDLSILTATEIPVTEQTELAAIDALATGMVAKTADATYLNRTITGTAGNITITNGDGIAGNPTLDIGTSIVTLTGSQTLTNKTLTDSATFFQDETDNTKKLQLQLSGITTATTRTLTIPDLSGTIAVIDAVQTYTSGQVGEVTTLTDAASIAIDLSLSNNFTVTLAGNRTLANPTNAVAGQSGIILVFQDATGSRTLAYDTNYDFIGGTAPVLTTGIGSALDTLHYFVVSSTRILITEGLDWK